MWKPGEIPYSHYRETLIKLNILPLTYDREIKDLVFFYKSKYGSLDINVSEQSCFLCSTWPYSSLCSTLQDENLSSLVL